MNTSPELQGSIDTTTKTLADQREAFVSKLRDALKLAGFTTTYTLALGRFEVSKLVVKSDTLKTFVIYGFFYIKTDSRWSEMPTKVELRWGTSDNTWRNRNTRYSRLDDAQVAKLVKDAQDTLQMRLDQDVSRNQAEADKKRWEHERAMRLAGHVVPPGTEVNIIYGTGSDAGKFMVRFNGTSGIDKKPLTRDQVIRLLDLLNEIQGTEDAYVIVGVRNDQQVFFTTFGWMVGNGHTFTLEEAQRELASIKANRVCGDAESIEIVPYAVYNTIRP